MKPSGGMGPLWNTGRFENVVKRSLWLRYLPWVVLTLTLAGSWHLWKNAERHALEARQVEFGLRVQAAADRIRQRMLDYEQMLYGTRGFFINQREVERREFSGYIESLQLAQRLPGIQGVSYAPRVAAPGLRAHVAAMRKDGLGEYAIRPLAVREQYAPVAYIEPQSPANLGVLGFDNFSNPQRRATLETARDLDEAVLSDKLTLMQEDGKAPQPGCLMFLPVYRTNAPHATLADRRANVVGWLAASFRMKDLMAGLVKRDVDELDIEIHDGADASAESLLFDSDDDGGNLPPRAPLFHTSMSIEIAGHTWGLTAHSLPAFEAGLDESKARLTALAALLLSLGLTWITAMLVRDRSRAVQLAEGASSELRRNKEFQAALQESERRWNLALEAAGHGVWDWDIQNDAVTYSALSLQILECSAEGCPANMAGWRALIHPEDLPRVMAAYQSHMEGKAPFFNAECRVPGKSSSWKWIISRAMIVERDRQGKPTRMLGTHTDISDRRAMQAAMEEQKQFLDQVIDSLPGSFYVLDANGKQIRWNKNAERVSGYTPEEIAGRHALDYFEGEDRAAIQKSIRQVFENGEGEVEAELVVKSGRKIPYHYFARRAVIGGKPYLIGLSLDISERKAAERALRLSEAKLQAIIDNAPVGIWLVGVDGRYHFFNKTFCDSLGIPERDLLAATNISDVLGPDVAAACIQSDRAALAQDAPHISHETLTFADGNPHQLEIRKVKLHDHVGETIGVLGISVDVTEQREREEALRESEVRYHDIFNDTNYFIFTLDTEARISFAPTIIEKLTGHTAEELTGAHISKILTPESLTKAREMIARKFSGEAAVTQYEMDFLRKDGSIMPIEVNTSLLYKKGAPAGIQGVGRDITERRNYEKALRESEETYRGLFESAGDFAYSTDMKGCFTAVSDALLAATGHARDEMVHAPISKIVAPEYLELAQRMTTAKLAGESQVTRYELELITKGGARIPVEVVSTLVYKDGQPARVQGIGRDITERRRAEALLRRSERNYRELMEQAAEAIFVTDHEVRHCVDVNQAACDLLDYTREELMKLEFSALFHPDDRAHQPLASEEARTGGATFARRRFRRKDGALVPVEISARMLPDGRLQAMVRDVSEWIEREKALREANIKAEAASRTKSEFLANMSHEIRTPMNSVIGMARLALSRETDARQIDYLEKILMSGEHLLGIIDDILDFSKIEAGKLQIECADFDLRALLGNLRGLMADKAAAKGLGFVVEMDPALPERVQGDPLRLRQILLNFADNAIKFTSRGEVRVNARRVNEGEAGCVAAFEVSDTGIGMSPVEMAMLFRPFQQTDGSVTRKYGGTGLGLSICKRIVELMGGTVGVESEPGRGTKFWFRVRLDEGSQDDAPAERWGDRRDVQAEIRNARILLAENNAFNQQVAREFLEIAGCVVNVANNGVEVLELLGAEHFDCILMDVQMPLMDGLEATRRIRAIATFATLPIIAVTANALEEEQQRCMEAGMNDFITKPVRPELLYNMLAKWLSRQMLPLSVPDRKKLAADKPPRQAAIDFAVLAELVGGNPQRMRQMAGKFMDTTSSDMDKVKAALERHDLAELRAMGHHIKAAAAMVGAAHLAELCRALEGSPDDLNVARKLVNEMSAQLAEIEGHINAEFP